MPTLTRAWSSSAGADDAAAVAADVLHVDAGVLGAGGLADDIAVAQSVLQAYLKQCESYQNYHCGTVV